MKNLWNKISLIWKGRTIATQLLNLKSKWKEPTFWVALLGNALSTYEMYKGNLDPRTGIIINSVLTSAYNYVRGLQKAETDGVKSYSTSSEMWMGLVTMANNAAIGIQTGGISTPYLAAGTMLVGHAIAAARDLANMRPKEVAAAGAASDVAPATVISEK